MSRYWSFILSIMCVKNCLTIAHGDSGVATIHNRDPSLKPSHHKSDTSNIPPQNMNSKISSILLTKNHEVSQKHLVFKTQRTLNIPSVINNIEVFKHPVSNYNRLSNTPSNHRNKKGGIHIASMMDVDIMPASCINTGENLLKKFSGVWNVWYCQQHCKETSGCDYMTFYSSVDNSRMNHTCFLFRTCPLRNPDCRGCLTGSSSSDVSFDQCLVPPLRGGNWSCSHNQTEDGKVWDLTTCYFLCKGFTTAITCHHGKWDRNISSINCPCKELDRIDGLDCSPGMIDGQVEGGTVCTKTCGLKLFSTTCHQGTWSDDLSDIDCVDGWMALLTALLVLAVIAVAACLCVFYLLGYSRSRLKPRESHA